MLNPSFLPVSDGIRILRVFAAQDTGRYLAAVQDPLIQEFGYLPAANHTERSVEQLAETVAPQGLTRGDLGLLSIVDKSDLFLGSLVLFNATRDSAEVGVWLLPQDRGSGHALGALKLAATFAKQSGLRELTARNVEDNYASKYVVERAGFEEVARGMDKTPSGEQAPHVHYRLVLRS
ncbi:MAG TPA: GNAT family N-acetyltransferase [Candidatus Yaniella excrementavium]|nr:GNAT family N-acetyltransferase [Candidatus Yaniella excrementavium]